MQDDLYTYKPVTDTNVALVGFHLYRLAPVLLILNKHKYCIIFYKNCIFWDIFLSDLADHLNYRFLTDKGDDMCRKGGVFYLLLYQKCKTHSVVPG